MIRDWGKVGLVGVAFGIVALIVYAAAVVIAETFSA